MATFYATYSPSSSSGGGGGNPAAGLTGTPVPASGDYIAFNVAGNLVGVSAANPLPVDIHLDTVTVSENLAQVNGATVNVGTGASGTGTQRVAVSTDSSISVSNFPATQPVSGTVTVVQPTGTNLHAVIDSGTITANAGTGNFTVVQSSGTNLHVNIDNFPATQPVSGSVSVSNFPATQAVTQSTSPWVENVSQFGGNAVVTGTGASGVGIPRVTVSNDSNILATQSGTWTVTPLVNTNGSASNSTTVTNTSATTFSAPANAVGFVVEAESSNTVNLRYACGTTATTSVGMLLEPGRDSGFIPSKGTVTVICATAATNQAAGIQWVLSS